MASGKGADRKARLAAALKQNLKRRKTANSKSDKDEAVSQGVGLGAGTAPQKGLRPMPAKSPKTASKRN